MCPLFFLVAMRGTPEDSFHRSMADDPTIPPRTSRSESPGSSREAEGLAGVRHIELSLRNIHQLFNTMDPSPFHEKDLDDDAAEFILGWAEEFHRLEPVDLIIHLETLPEGTDPRQLAENAVHNYFAYRTRLNRLDFKRLMKQGRMSLIVGLAFMAACFTVIELVGAKNISTIPSFFKEGLTIAGWVAMWRPLEIYLYEWWPLRRRGQVLDKLSRMAVQVRLKS